MTHVVALAVSEGVPIYELAAPCAIFGVDHRDLSATDWYRFVVCSPPGARVDSWLTSTSPHTYADLVAADTVIVPACHDQALTPPADLVDAVREAAARGARMVSICTGAFVLAAAGVLDGRRATTHWAHAGTLAERHPAVEVDLDPIYVDEGDVLTSAGKSAGTDLCLHLVRKDYGAEVANRVARHLVTPPHREGTQRQYVEPVTATATGDDLNETLQWALGRLDEPLSVDQLARHAGVSVRTLHRHFVRRTGARPLEWLNAQRVRRAQELLETSDLTVDHVADLCGFGSAVALRRNVLQALDTTPDAYRRTFAGATRRTAEDPSVD